MPDHSVFAMFVPCGGCQRCVLNNVGQVAHFSFLGLEMRNDPNNLVEVLEPVVRSLGFELVGVEYHPAGGRSLLRVYIDSADGISVDDCARVSHHVSGVLDVEDPIPGHYTLEVSSPGLDRPLFTVEQYRRFAGHKVRVQLSLPVAGRRKWVGVLIDCEDDQVRLDVDGQVITVPLAQIERSRLVPEF